MPLAVVLRHPPSCLGRRFGDVAPQRLRVRICASDVGGGAPFHPRGADAPLERAVPDRRVARAPLVIGVEPAGRPPNAPHVLDRTDTATEVADIDGVACTFPGHVVPPPPEVHDPGPETA